MKKRQLTEYRAKPVEELQAEVSKLRDKKLATEAAVTSGKEKNLKAVSNIRRDIAQMLTLKNIIERQEKDDKEKGEKKSS